MPASRHIRRLSSFAIVLCIVPLACGDPATTSPTVTGVSQVRYGKGGGGPGGDDPSVTSAVPDMASQGTTLDVEIGGSGFDEGTTVEFAIGGVPSGAVTVNATQFLNSRKLRSNITVAEDADTVLYDVVVMTARGRPGIGTELFKVNEAVLDVIGSFSVAPGHGITGDGQGDYVTGGKQKSEVVSFLSASSRWLRMDEGSGRTICVHFPPPDEIRSPDDWADFMAELGVEPGGDPLCIAETHHTRDNTNLLTMNAGEGRTTGGKLALSGGRWEWRLLYDDGHTYEHVTDGSLIDDLTYKSLGADTIQYEARPSDQGVCVTFDGTTWTLGTGSALHPSCVGVVDDKVNLLRLVGKDPPQRPYGGFVWVATFTMTFEETLTPR